MAPEFLTSMSGQLQSVQQVIEDVTGMKLGLGESFLALKALCFTWNVDTSTTSLNAVFDFPTVFLEAFPWVFEGPVSELD